MKKLPLAYSVLLILGFFFLVPGAFAQDDVRFLNNEATVNFPETVTFRLELSTDQPLIDAKLTYQLGQDSCLDAGTQVPVEVSGSTLEWTWVMSRSGNPPPGAEMWWQWQVTSSDGEVYTTTKNEITFVDDRFDWQTVSTGHDNGSAPITLNWYRGDEVGSLLLEAAAAGLQRLETDVGILIDGEIQFFIYGDTEDMREALLYVQDWAGGVAFDEYDTILIGVPPSLASSWGRETVRHELAHLVIGEFAQSCLGGTLPTWLSEGLAVYAEGEPDEQTIADIEAGIQNNTFQPVRSLNGAFPARGNEAGLAYSQSYSLVAFLLDSYGEDRIQTLLQSLAAGLDYDTALEQIYGFNADGLEVAWREAIGAQPRAIPPTPTPLSAASIPTTMPLDAVRNQPTPPPAEIRAIATPLAEKPEESDTPSPFSCTFGLVPIVMVFGLAFAIPASRQRSLKKRKK